MLNTKKLKDVLSVFKFSGSAAFFFLYRNIVSQCVVTRNAQVCTSVVPQWQLNELWLKVFSLTLITDRSPKKALSVLVI